MGLITFRESGFFFLILYSLIINDFCLFLMYMTYPIAGLHMYRAILSVDTSTKSLLFHQSCKNQVPHSQNAMAHNLFSQFTFFFNLCFFSAQYHIETYKM